MLALALPPALALTLVPTIALALQEHQYHHQQVQLHFWTILCNLPGAFMIIFLLGYQVLYQAEYHSVHFITHQSFAFY